MSAVRPFFWVMVLACVSLALVNVGAELDPLEPNGHLALWWSGFTAGGALAILVNIKWSHDG